VIRKAPDFINSPYLIIDDRGWRLLEDAPEELRIKFDDFMKSLNMLEEH